MLELACSSSKRRSVEPFAELIESGSADVEGADEAEGSFGGDGLENGGGEGVVVSRPQKIDEYNV